MATVKCARVGCGKRRVDENMIYSVPADEYTCSQRCKDIHEGIVWDKDGFVVSIEHL